MSPATLQKVSLTVRDGFIDWHRLGMLSRSDAIRVGLGWVGTGSGLVLFALSVLVGLAFIPLVHERPNMMPEALPDTGRIPELANGATFTAAVAPDFSNVRTVRATKRPAGVGRRGDATAVRRRAAGSRQVDRKPGPPATRENTGQTSEVVVFFPQPVP